MTGTTSPTDNTALAPSGARVVVNRHIPPTWNQFYVEPHTERRKRLCGTRGPSKYEGIPGITPQALIFDGRPGWCEECIKELFNWYNEHYKSIVTIPEVQEVYNIVFFEMFRFMRAMVDNRRDNGR